jgi:hypothetical protein
VCVRVYRLQALTRMEMELEIKRLAVEAERQEIAGEWGSMKMLRSTPPLSPQDSLQGTQV